MTQDPSIRILFLADTHLGFDLPFHPRIQRRRRGHDFFNNYQAIMNAAQEQKADLIVHGGDLFYRSKFPVELARMAFAPMLRLAKEGLPVYIVPGNHERSTIPFAHLIKHSNIHIFDRPRTFVRPIRGVRVSLAGYPFVRQHIRHHFKKLLQQTGYLDLEADIRLLCIHQCLEGARVGPVGYTFRSGPDVIKVAQLPPDLDGVLTGHIHRHQVLTRDLNGKPLSAPVLYPGAIERTSYAEMDEPKGYMILNFVPAANRKRYKIKWKFESLPTRPMVELVMADTAMTATEMNHWIERSLQDLHPDSIVRIKIFGRIGSAQREVLKAASLRRLTPETMNVEAVLVDERRYRSK